MCWKEKYATVFYCTVSRDGTLRWVNAGHVTPFLVRSDGEMLELKTTGLPLGMLEIAQYEVETLHMQSGDKIVAYSDGLSEAQNAEGAFFETSRMTDMIAAHASRSAAEMHRALMQQVETFTQGTVQHDDITALVMEFRG